MKRIIYYVIFICFTLLFTSCNWFDSDSSSSEDGSGSNTTISSNVGFILEKNTDNTYTIISYTGTATSISIPNSIAANNITNTNIISNNKNLIDIQLINNIEISQENVGDYYVISKIAEAAFANKGIVSLSIEDNIIIEKGAFKGNQIKSLTLGKGLTFGDNVFDDDSLVEGYDKNLGSSIYQDSIYKLKLENNTYSIIKYFGTEANLIIPATINNKTISRIKTNAFKNNTNLITIDLVDGLYIENEAFAGTNNLVVIYIGANCTIENQSIGINSSISTSTNEEITFVKYDFLNNIFENANAYYNTNGNSITGSSFFFGTSTDIIIPKKINGFDIMEIGENAFNSRYFTSILLPDTLTTIGAGAFFETMLTSLTIPDSVTTICDRAFGGCGLVSVSLSKNLETIGENAFYSNHLISITIPDSVTTIMERAFLNNNLNYAYIPATVTSIGNGAFFGNDDLNNTNVHYYSSVNPSGIFDILITKD